MPDATFIYLVSPKLCYLSAFWVESALPTPIPFTKSTGDDGSGMLVMPWYSVCTIIVIYDVDFYMVQHIKNTMLLPWHIKITKYNFKKNK